MVWYWKGMIGNYTHYRAQRNVVKRMSLSAGAYFRRQKMYIHYIAHTSLSSLIHCIVHAILSSPIHCIVHVILSGLIHCISHTSPSNLICSIVYTSVHPV